MAEIGERMNDERSPLLKIPQVVKRLRLNKDSVHALIESGDLRASNVATAGAVLRQLRVSEEDLAAFIAARRVKLIAATRKKAA